VHHRINQEKVVTNDERALLIKTAQALGSISHLLASGCGLHEFGELFAKINQDIAPLVDRLSGCTCKPVATNLPHLAHMISTNQCCPLHGTTLG
jgi:hypothetical protein